MIRGRRAVLAAALAANLLPGGLSGQASPLAGFRLVDLTHAFDSTTIFWPTSPSAFELERLAYGETEAGYFYSANRFRTPEHGGTHIDAPIHFGREGLTLDQIPLDRLLAPAVVLDVSAEADRDPDYRLRVDDVRRFEEKYGTVPPGAIVVLRTGWGRFWPDRRRYLGDDTPGDASNLHFPSYGEEAARLLVRERGAVALAVDAASIDYGQSTDFPVHRIAAAANVPGFENLAAVEALPPRGAWIIALPMKIAGGSGGPLRAVALVPSEEGD